MALDGIPAIYVSQLLALAFLERQPLQVAWPRLVPAPEASCCSRNTRS